VSAVVLLIVPRRSGYVATSREPAIVAMGRSAMAAAENGVRAVRTILSKTDVLPALIIRVERPGHTTIVMQPIDQPISLDVDGSDRLKHRRR